MKKVLLIMDSMKAHITEDIEKEVKEKYHSCNYTRWPHQDSATFKYFNKQFIQEKSLTKLHSH